MRDTWDMSFYSEKVNISKFSVSHEELREYFPLATVQEGLFKVVKQLFKIDVVQVKNDDLWKALDILAGKHQIEWLWVKGHAGNEGNERADELANAGVEQVLGNG